MSLLSHQGLQAQEQRSSLHRLTGCQPERKTGGYLCCIRRTGMLLISESQVTADRYPNDTSLDWYL